MTDKPTKEDRPADFSEQVTASGYGPQTARLYQFLTSRVIGQERAAHRLARSFAIHHAGLKDPRKPINAVVFSGPTGVGKTMMAGELAKYLIEDQIKPPMTTVDCQLFIEHHQLSQLIGSPPGYVGYNEPPLLSQLKIDGPHFWVKFREHMRTFPDDRVPKDKKEYDQFVAQMYKQLGPYVSVILFDEVEKAHRQIHSALLGIIDKGEAVLANGKHSDFTSSVIVLTCNIGGRHASDLLAGRRKQIGLLPQSSARSTAEAVDQAIFEDTLSLIKKFFPPEFVGRLRDQIVVFRALGRDDCRLVLENQLAMVQQRTNASLAAGIKSGPKPPPIVLHYSQAFKEMVLDEGVSSEWGLRKLEQAVKQRITLELANAMEAQEVRPGDEVLFDMQGDRPVMFRKKRQTVTVSSSNGKPTGPIEEVDTDPLGIDIDLPPEDGWDPEGPDKK